MKRIEIASFGKRLLAGILDGGFFALIWFILAMFVMTPIMNSTMHYSDQMVLGLQYQIASHIYVVRQSIDINTGEQQLIEVKDYSEKLDESKTSEVMGLNESSDLSSNYLLEHLQYFYCNYLTGKDIELPNNTEYHTYDMIADNFVAPNYNNEIELLDGTRGYAKDKYTPEWFFVNKLESNEMYSFNEESGKYVAKEGIDEEASRKFLRNKVGVAQKDLYYQDFYTEMNNKIKGSQLCIALIPFVVDLLVVYLLFPMIFKNGETLGKVTAKICLVNKNGYSVTKPQVLFRFFAFAFEISLFTFVVGIGFTSLATLGIGVLILMFIALFDKKHRTLHDFIAGTLIVDTNKSVWFKNIDEEERYRENLDNNMAKYRSRKVEEKGVLQIKGEIVDEEALKEVNELKSKNDKK